MEPTFSPSDTFFVANCFETSGGIHHTNNLYVINIESGQQVPVPACESITCTSPAWSPTGEYFAVKRSRGALGEPEEWEGAVLGTSPVLLERRFLRRLTSRTDFIPQSACLGSDGIRLAFEMGIDTLEVLNVRSGTSIVYTRSRRTSA